MARRNLAKAVAGKCRECIYDPENLGTANQQIMACTSFTCPLWPVRPVNKDTTFSRPLREELEDRIAPEAIDAWERSPWTPPPVAGAVTVATGFDPDSDRASWLTSISASVNHSSGENAGNASVLARGLIR